jgi:IS5 family transposase
MTIPIQLPLRPALPTVYQPHADYREQRALFERMDRILQESGSDLGLARDWLQERGGGVSEKKVAWLLTGIRCAIARKLTGMPLRVFAFRLLDSSLLQWFCRCGEYGIVHTPSKSALSRLEKLFDVHDLENLVDALTTGAMEADPSKRLGGLREPLELGDVFADCTCVKAPIHFPTDWVLLVDAVRTLMKAVSLIRRHGLRSRMPPPESFLRAINRQAMAMSGTRRAKDGRKRRKKTLRNMKKICGVVESHARRYRDLLDRRWEETDWTRKQAGQVLRRMDQILDQLPAAKKQAHERIIGRRKVPNGEKILSLYEPDVHVIRRGKAAAEVEFGNKLYLVEQADGMLVDWKLFQDEVPSDTRLVERSLERMKDCLGVPGGYVADRGFHSKANVKRLGLEIRDGLCAKDPAELKERMRDPWYAAAQKRRGATEGRIGVFKNVFLGGVMREKGFESRNRALIWSVLAHNLWVLARKSLADEAERLQDAA